MGNKKLDEQLLNVALRYDGDNEKRLREVRHLLSLGADVNVVDSSGTPLIVRLMESDKHNVISRELLKHGVYLGNKKLDEQLLNVALRYDGDDEKRLRKVKYLLRLGANVNVRDSSGTPLIVSLMASDKHNVISRELLKNGVYLWATDRNRKTALMMAVSYNSFDMVEELVNNNARIECVDTDGWTALFFAAYHGRKDVAELLVKKGADVNARGNSGVCVSPLMACCMGWRNNDEYRETAKFLLSKGADIWAKNSEGLSILEFVKDCRNDELYDFLKKEGTKGLGDDLKCFLGRFMR